MAIVIAVHIDQIQYTMKRKNFAFAKIAIY